MANISKDVVASRYPTNWFRPGQSSTRSLSRHMALQIKLKREKLRTRTSRSQHVPDLIVDGIGRKKQGKRMNGSDDGGWEGKEEEGVGDGKREG